MSILKNKLSGSTNGKLIKVVATATPGTLIHTAVSGTTDLDEIWIYAVNTSNAKVNLTIEWGGVASPGDLIEVGIQGGEGLVLVIPGAVLNNGKIIRAFADSANVINILGWVNEIR